MALMSVGLGVLTSYGLCSLMGLAYGPMHSLIPCLLVGLGVDNAFVLVQAVQNVNEAEAGMLFVIIILVYLPTKIRRCFFKYV